MNKSRGYRRAPNGSINSCIVHYKTSKQTPFILITLNCKYQTNLQERCKLCQQQQINIIRTIQLKQVERHYDSTRAIHSMVVNFTIYNGPQTVPAICVCGIKLMPSTTRKCRHIKCVLSHAAIRDTRYVGYSGIPYQPPQTRWHLKVQLF